MSHLLIEEERLSSSEGTAVALAGAKNQGASSVGKKIHISKLALETKLKKLEVVYIKEEYLIKNSKENLKKDKSETESNINVFMGIHIEDMYKVCWYMVTGVNYYGKMRVLVMRVDNLYKMNFVSNEMPLVQSPACETASPFSFTVCPMEVDKFDHYN
ncbi:hypothetical protein PR048_012205 [Dryococelus australis]|uniref:Uncharacterized protein n=1 Tax=Dryococelus australis TaxID=614101 RepID=A0ABQ9HPC5_9NEOP|nr:hypothetical protein PR048_012205 [Dryococelus australis]